MAVSARLLGKLAEATVRANSTYRQYACGENETPWETMDNDARKEVINAVARTLAARVETPEQCHLNWMEVRQAHGWTYGEMEDREHKVSPNILPWEQLTPQAKAKSELFLSILKPFYDY